MELQIFDKKNQILVVLKIIPINFQLNLGFCLIFLLADPFLYEIDENFGATIFAEKVPNNKMN